MVFVLATVMAIEVVILAFVMKKLFAECDKEI